MDCSTPGFPVLCHLPELAQTHVHWVSKAIQPSHPLSPTSSSTFNLPRSRVFSNESSLGIRWPKDWSISISSSNEYSGLISFRIDRLNLLAVQGTLKSLLQYHISKASILQCSAFFMVKLSHPYMTTGRAIVPTKQTFVDKVIPGLTHLNFLMSLINILHFHSHQHIQIFMFLTLLFPSILPFFLIVFHSIQAHVLPHES